MNLVQFLCFMLACVSAILLMLRKVLIKEPKSSNCIEQLIENKVKVLYGSAFLPVCKESTNINYIKIKAFPDKYYLFTTP